MNPSEKAVLAGHFRLVAMHGRRRAQQAADVVADALAAIGLDVAHRVAGSEPPVGHAELCALPPPR